MELIRAGLIVAKRRLGLAVTLFVGEALVQLVGVAGLVVLFIAAAHGVTLTALEFDDPGALDLLRGTLVHLSRPLVIIGVGGTMVVSLLAALGLGSVLRGGAAASLARVLSDGGRFRLGSFLRSGFLLLDRSLPISLLGVIAPWCGLLFSAPGILAAWPSLTSALAFGSPLPTGAALLVSASLTGGVLLAASLAIWARLTMAEVVLRPELTLSRALREGAHLLAGELPTVLRLSLVTWAALFGLGLLFVYVSSALGSLAAQSGLAPLMGLVETGLGIVRTLLLGIVALAYQLTLIVLCARHRVPELLEPRPAAEAVAARARRTYRAVQQGLTPEAEAPLEAQAPARIAPTRPLLDPRNVFVVDELRRAPSLPEEPAAETVEVDDGEEGP